jgi:NitT/TauT family transport system substrate-binding protein
MAAPKGPNLATFFNDPSAAVAGYLTAEPFLAVQRNVPVKFFLFAEQGYPPYANTMVTTAAYMKDNSDVVARFTRASVEGLEGLSARSQRRQRAHQEAQPADAG